MQVVLCIMFLISTICSLISFYPNLKNKVKEQGENSIDNCNLVFYGDIAKISDSKVYINCVKTRYQFDVPENEKHINKELFYEAMEATKEYTKQRQKNRPKDYRRLKDASYSLQEAKGLLNQQVESEDFELTTTDKLKQWILQQDKEWEKEGRKIEEQKKKIMTLKEEIKSFTDFQWNLLTMALNDRTMLDHTTDLAAGENSNIYVNEDKRSRFKEYDVKNPIIKLEQINNAAKTLLSYQLRDDGVLSYGHLTKKDFAPEALERSTKVDWDLLKRAISLVKEVS